MATPTKQNSNNPSKEHRSKQDVAHSPGHKKINRLAVPSGGPGGKTHPQNESALNHMANSDKIFRSESPQRRIIPGASIEKKGRREIS